MDRRLCLGQLLIGKGLLTESQLRAALDAQLQFQGRLGTNLIELGLLTEDRLAFALGEQHGVAFATDTELLGPLPATRLLTSRAAKAYRTVPLGWTDDSKRTLRVATADPGDLRVLDDLRALLCCRIEPVVVAELRLEDLLAKHYGIERPKRNYVRLRDVSSDLTALAGSSDTPLPLAASKSSVIEASLPAARMLLTPPPLPDVERIRVSECPPTQASWNHPIIATRSFPQRPALSGLVAPIPSAPPGAFEGPISAEEGLVDAIARTTSSLPPSSRTHATQYAIDVQHRSVPLVSSPAPPPHALEWDFDDTSGVTDAAVIKKSAFLRTLEDLAATSDRDLAAERLLAYLSGRFECALVMLVKGEVAYGWKGYARDASPNAIESLVVPLSVPSLFQLAAETGRPFHGPPPDAGARLQSRFWKTLGCEPPSEAIVTPIHVGTRLVNLIYAHAEQQRRIKPVARANLAALASATGLAYRRAIKRAAV